MKLPIDRGRRQGPCNRQVRSLIEGLAGSTLLRHSIREVQQPLARPLGAHREALKSISRGVALIHIEFCRNDPRILSPGLHSAPDHFRSANIKMFGGGKLEQTVRRIRKVEVAIEHFRTQSFIARREPGGRPGGPGDAGRTPIESNQVTFDAKWPDASALNCSCTPISL